MLKTVEAVIETDGSVRLVEIDEENDSETALLSEASLSEDWDRPEEDEAWRHLQPAQ